MPITQQQFLQGPSTPGGVTLNLTGADVAAGSIAKANLAAFVSATIHTGTGSSQSIAHGLGVVPSVVYVFFTGSTASQEVTEGTHTNANIVLTVTSGATYKVFAFA